MITGNGSEVTATPQIYPSLGTDLIIGSLHLIGGVLAVLGNGVVFFAYFRDASQRASACMFVELSAVGILVGCTSLYGGVYLVRGRQVIDQMDTASHQYYFELSVGHMWWFGYTCTIMLVTTLSTIRGWSIASPFRYKMYSSRLVTAVMSGLCWTFGVLWLAVRYILQCKWTLQSFFTYSVPFCPENLYTYKFLVFPLDVIPILCGTVLTTISNSYVIKELAKSYRNPTAQQARETFTKTTFMIVLLTSFFLICYIPTLVFYFLNSLEEVSDISVISSCPPRLFITLFAVKFLIPTLYPAISPILQFCGLDRQRQQLTFRIHAASLFKRVPSSAHKLQNNHKLVTMHAVTRGRVTAGVTVSDGVLSNGDDRLYSNMSPQLKMRRIMTTRNIDIS